MKRLVSFAALAILGCTGVSSNLDATPTNDLPDPYRAIIPWGTLPEGHAWGALNAVWVDNDGKSLWVADRCGANPDVPPGESPFLYDTCAGSDWAPVHKLDAGGRIVKSFGAGMFVFPHKIYQDREGNVWVVDMRGMNPREKAKYPAKAAGHAAVKFSPEGRMLLILGNPGVAGNPPSALTEPCSIAVAKNGDIYVSEGHSGQQPDAKPGTVARISVFSRDGKFIRSFGKLGSGPAEFKTPHDIFIDEEDRLFVADRGNHRVQVLDLEGKYIAEWKQYGRPSGVVVRNGLVYVADSESNGVAPNPGWKRGIRVGELKSGKVLYRIPDPLEMKGTSAAEGVAVDAAGSVYGGEVGPRRLVKYFRE
ncbi:MAG TPA: peptidyl-alpha-hydroxyglycine alpha-amidating lyase family protein [Burkholderiales bacterium]|nr:peptidyl-alpha-hydroxyglycine alpha-amidating lyase family protein [Burkholderiales bacterium]